MNIFILLVSLGMVIYMSWQIYTSIDLRYNSDTTEGTITGYYKRQGDARFIWNRKDVFAPVFSYQTKVGKEIEVITSSYKKEMKYQKGDTVTVYYNPQKPEKAQIADSFPWTRHVVLLVFGILGVIFTLSPIFGYKT